MNGDCNQKEETNQSMMEVFSSVSSYHLRMSKVCRTIGRPPVPAVLSQRALPHTESVHRGHCVALVHAFDKGHGKKASHSWNWYDSLQS